MLDDLLAEIAHTPRGRSRSVSLVPIDDTVPQRVFPSAPFRRLGKLRIGLSENDAFAISVNDGEVLISLSNSALDEFREALAMLRAGQQDFCLVGDSGDYTDRVWFWALE